MPKKVESPVEDQQDIQVEEIADPVSQVETGIVKLSHFEEKLEEVKKLKDLTIKDVSDKKGYQAVETARKQAKAEKAKVENVRKALVGPLNDMVGQINGKAKELWNGFKEVEDDLDAKASEHEDLVEQERVRKFKEAEEKFNNRLDQIQTIGAKYSGFGNSYKIGEISITTAEIKSLPDEDFINVTTLMEEASIEQRRIEREEEERQAQLKADQEAEATRLAEQAKALAQQQAELEKAKKELEEAKAAMEKAAAEKAQADLIESENTKREAEKARKELLRGKRILDLIKITDKIEEDAENHILAYEGHVLLNIDDMIDMSDEYWADTLKTLPTALAQVDDEIRAEAARVSAEEAKRTKAAADAAVATEKRRVEAEKKEADRQLKLQPDKQRFALIAETINALTEDFEPVTPEGKKLLVALEDKLSDLSTWVTEKSKSL